LNLRFQSLSVSGWALATELGLEGSDLLDPEAGAMRDLSEGAFAAAKLARERLK
jgi:hypothetical protein